MVSTPTHLSLRLLALPARRALGAAHGVGAGHDHRFITLVGVHHDNDVGTVAGWGECAALNSAGYTPEWAEGAFDLLRSGRSFDRTNAPMATAAIEMAFLDADLKASGQSLAERLGTAGSSAPAGAVIGLAPIPTMLNQIESLAADGYGRIKLKIAPDRIAAPVGAVRTSFPDLELQVDANASLDEHDLAELAALRDLGVTVIEQPFPPGRHDLAARLVAESGMHVAADEAVRCEADVDALAHDGAATAIVVKPSKLGGVGPALRLVDRAAAHGLQASLGGMLESGLGRHVLAALAPLAPFTITGDLSPARQWLLDDPFRDVTMRRGSVAAPARPGIAGEPMMNRLRRYTVRHALVVADTARAAVGEVQLS